ncbi:hypothetical protein [Mongoliibacter ruber]|uniref:Uncharacterized protein n=1 Tax=Mongoliibacter ruber TaxID=1750599 RepID=A0A2T0WSH5_9BACT|nr:hypothetical protein [Mongoliibacter ruber]PRY89642.1 hypothetical protein CLW00_102118 [Mongoliibacter ruber]
MSHIDRFIGFITLSEVKVCPDPISGFGGYPTLIGGGASTPQAYLHEIGSVQHDPMLKSQDDT